MACPFNIGWKFGLVWCGGRHRLTGVKRILLMIGLVALVGCGKKEPVQPSASNSEATKPEKERGKEATQPTTPKPEATKPEPTKAKATAGVKLWEFETGDGVFSSPAIGSDGTVYVGSYDKKLYALKTESKGLAKSPWPMRGQNARHTGRVMKK